MRVVVTGSRHVLADKADIVFRRLDRLHARRRIRALATGDGSGIDALAEEWAVSHNITAERFTANWREFGKKAGPIRNRRMLDEFKPDLVIAFPGGVGTADCVKAAKQRGIRTVYAELR